MTKGETLTCRCGSVAMAVAGVPFLVVDCLCSSCRTAGAVLEALPGAPRLLDDHGATRLVLYRKDRAVCTQGPALLKEHRLKSATPTRRVVASCCNTPMFLDFTKGSWIDLYGTAWGDAEPPRAAMRIMAGDLPKGWPLPDDLPNHKGRPLSVFARIFGTWAAMGFRVPHLDYVQGGLDVAR